MKNLSKLLLFLSIVGCYDPDEYEINPRKQNNDILIFSKQEVTPDADGFSITVLTAGIPLNSDLDKREIKFTCSTGSFADNGSRSLSQVANEPVDLGGAIGEKLVTYVRFRSSLDIISSRITASIGGVEKYLYLNFNRVPPQQLNVTTPSFSLDSGYNNQIVITALAKRDHGLPTLNEPILFSVTDTSPNYHALGYLSQNIALTDTAGSARTIFTAGNSPYKGLLIVKAVALNNASVSDTTIVQLH